MIKFGQVTAYDRATGEATIAYVRPDACAKCGACGHLNQTGEIRLKADCAVGDWVRVALPDHSFLSTATLAYLVPLALFLLGLGAGWLLSSGQDGYTLLGAAVGLGLGLVSLRISEKMLRGKPEWTPHVDAVYGSKPDIDDIGCQK